jgi:hypothetical protein
LYKIVYDRLKEVFVPKGYKAASKCFWRQQGDLLHAIALYKLPRSESGELKLVCEACIYSTELDIKLGYETDPTWPSSQIRVDLDLFRPRIPGSYQPPITCRTPEEAERAADMIIDLLLTKALPIVEGMRTTDDMIPILRSGPNTAKSRARSNYDADVWEGKIDPKIDPFIPSPELRAVHGNDTRK